MSAATAVNVRDLATGTECLAVDVTDMPSGTLTVQHILDRAGVSLGTTSSVLADGRKVTDMDAVVDSVSEILMVPNVANG